MPETADPTAFAHLRMNRKQIDYLNSLKHKRPKNYWVLRQLSPKEQRDAMAVMQKLEGLRKLGVPIDEQT